MPQYLHFYDSESAFTTDYDGEAYKEPWVSYTDENGGTPHVNYNKRCEIVRNVVTSLTATDDGLYDVDSMDYKLVEVFRTPRTAIDFQGDAEQLYARYEPVSGTSEMGTQWVTGYLTVDPTGHTEGYDKFVTFYEGRYSDYEPTLAPVNFGISGFSFGDGYTCPDPYDNKNWKIVATFNGTISDTSDPYQGDYGSEMTILENTMPEYPFTPDVYTISGGNHFDAEISFTVNGVTYTNNTPGFTPFYVGDYGQKHYLAASYIEGGGETPEAFIGFRYVLSERKLYVYTW